MFRIAFAAIWLISSLALDPAQAMAEKFTVILLHGKGGSAHSRAMRPLTDDMESAGFEVVNPDMPWSRGRGFDVTFEAALEEIHALVQAARKSGAGKVVVAGHSLGANAAIAYGAVYGGIDGVAAIAPGHVPRIWARRRLKRDVAKARAMAEAGRGAETADFNDINQGRNFTRRLPAKTYLSYWDPDGGAVMPRNVARLKKGVALLWIIGEKDRMMKMGKDYAYDKAPEHPNNAYIVVRGGHIATPRLGADEIIAWLKTL